MRLWFDFMLPGNLRMPQNYIYMTEVLTSYENSVYRICKYKKIEKNTNRR